jgi:uncharacterized protein YutE (UPF0331/DUF86 family)
MPVNGVVSAKLSLLSSYLERLKPLVPPTLADLQANWERQKAVERALQVMIEIVIDVSDRLIAILGQPPAPTASVSLTRLQELGIIADASRYRTMVRFRNFIVHRYEDIDIDVLYSILTRRLPDFEEFSREITRYVSRSDK